MLEQIENGSQKLNKNFSAFIGGGLIIATTLLVVVDITLRSLIGTPIQGVYEVCETCMVWIVYSGMAYALITGQHVKVVLILNRLHPRLLPRFEAFDDLVGFVFSALLSYGGCSFFWNAWVKQTVPMAPVGVPLWIAAVLMSIGFILITVEFLIRFIRDLVKPS